MGRVVVLTLLLAAVLAGSAGASETTGRLLVSVEPGAGASGPVVARAAAAVRADGPRVPEIGLVTVVPARGVSVREAARRLRERPEVRAVEVERRFTPRALPDDPALGDAETSAGVAPGTPVQWWVPRLGLPEAWEVEDGAGARVGIVDSGVDGTHPDLAGKVVGEVDADPTPGRGGPRTDEAGHGTHVAALACAATNNNTGIAGAGGGCGLIVGKTDFSDASVAQAIVALADAGADAINLSFGTDGTRQPPQAIEDALAYARGKGAVLVAAAADAVTDEQGDPANLLQPSGTGPNLEQHNAGLSVTAATHSDKRAWFAGRGAQISLAAYGAYERDAGPRGLLSAWPHNPTTFEQGAFGPPPLPPCRCRTGFRGDPRYAHLQGTSMATALVTGVAALVKHLNPDLPPSDVVRLLKQTARRPAGTGWEPELGWGIVDARAAVEAARRLDRRPPTSRTRARVRADGRIALTWSGEDHAPPKVERAGIDRYELWRTAPGRRASRLLATTTATRRTVRAPAAGRYTFFTVAIDRAGNREPKPPRPDATVRVARGR